MVDYFQCPREVVGVAMHLVDRYLGSPNNSNGAICSKREFKLLCLACLYLALKTERPSAVSLETLLSLSRDICTSEELLGTEQDVLRVLQWRLHPPTAFAFLEYYQRDLLVIAPSFSSSSSQQQKRFVNAISDTARYLVELSVIDYYFVQHRPSHVALGALLCAVEEAETSLLKQCTPAASATLVLEQYQHLMFLQTMQTRIQSLLSENEDSSEARSPVGDCKSRLCVIYSKTVSAVPSRRTTYKTPSPPSTSPNTVVQQPPEHEPPQQDPAGASIHGLYPEAKKVRFTTTTREDALFQHANAGFDANTKTNALLRMISPVQVAMLLDNLAGSSNSSSNVNDLLDNLAGSSSSSSSNDNDNDNIAQLDFFKYKN